MFTPRSAALCGASALVSLAIVAVVDRDVPAAGGRTFMLFATLAGAAVLSVSPRSTAATSSATRRP